MRDIDTYADMRDADDVSTSRERPSCEECGYVSCFGECTNEDPVVYGGGE